MAELFIDGNWTAGSDTRPVLNPLDGSVLTTVAEADAKDALRAVRAARAAFDAGPWPKTPAAERGALLNTVADLLLR